MLTIPKSNIKRPSLISSTQESEVYLGWWFQNEREYEVIIKIPKPAPVGITQDECKIHEKLMHPNIVPLIGVLAENKHAMVLEYMPRGNFDTFLIQNSYPGSATLQASIRRNIIIDVLKGLKFMHSKHYVHRDIKCANIFLAVSGPYGYHATIGDFGFSKEMDDTGNYFAQTHLKVGTLGNVAPENYTPSSIGCVYNEKTDVYALWQLFLRAGSNKMSQYLYPDAKSDKEKGPNNLVNRLPIIAEEVSDETRNIFFSCYRENPNNRPTVAMLLHAYQHPSQPITLSVESMQKLTCLIKVLDSFCTQPCFAAFFNPSVMAGLVIKEELAALRTWAALPPEKQVHPMEYSERFSRIMQKLKNVKDKNTKATLLIHAAREGQNELAQELIHAGADINAISDLGHTPLSEACMFRHVHVVNTLVAAKPDFARGTHLPLIVAARSGFLEIVELLVNAGAKPDQEDAYGNTALKAAQKFEHQGIVTFLQESISKQGSAGLTCRQ